MESLYKLGLSFVILATVLGQAPDPGTDPTQPSVDLNVGRIVGFVDTVGPLVLKKFLGIPFAKPPIGNQRFMKPEPLDSLQTSPYNATYFRPYCTQIDNSLTVPSMISEDEDCLYLNIYVPNTEADAQTGHAVMIWIYGGGYVAGSADIYDGMAIAGLGNVIVVTFNYRVGPFGFLSTMDENAPGNYGLFDQVMAIQWVHDNIAAFGGDADRVTLFGESAGSMSAVLQGLYSENYGKIRRIIAQSGSSINPLDVFYKDARPAAETIANHMQCPTGTSRELIECLKQIPWREFETLYSTLGTVTARMGPVIDGDFIKTDPTQMHELLKTRDLEEISYFRSLDFLCGINSYEGTVFLPFLANISEFDMEYIEPTQAAMMDWLIPGLIQYIYNVSFPEYLKETILHEYTDWSNPNAFESIRLQFAKMVGDATFVAPVVDTARIHVGSDTSEHTFLYYFGPNIDTHILPSPSWIPEAGHADELLFVFGYYLMNSDWRGVLSNKMLKYWTNFAKTGNPNYPSTVDDIWPSYNTTDQFYLELDEDIGAHSTKQFLGARETDFWLEVMSGLIDKTNTKPDRCITVAGASRPLFLLELLVTYFVIFYLLL